MSHYWTADDPIEARREQVRDWIEDLVEFGPATVADACREWRRTQSRRPTPADIRRLCVDSRQARIEHLAITGPVERWPSWLAEIWGPEPEGPRLRSAAMVRDEQRHRNTDGVAEHQRHAGAA